jgi:hypothetical protein
LGIAVGPLGFVAAIGIGADLATEGVFGFDDDRLAGLNSQARFVVARKFVVERAKGEALHGQRRRAADLHG